MKLPNIILNISKLLVAIFLVKISFNSKNIQKIIKETIVFFLITFIFAGCSLCFIHVIKPKVIYIVNGIIIGGEYIFEIVLISAIISCILIKIASKIIKTKLNKKDMICNLVIKLNNKKVQIKALLDTGNLLKDPITKQSVIIVEEDKIKSLFSEKELNIIRELLGGDSKKIENEEYNYSSKIRAIPFASVGKKDGIMIAYKVDNVNVEYQDEIKELDDVLIGIYNDTLSRNNKYSALIGLQILERGKVKNEYNTNIKSKSKYSIC